MPSRSQIAANLNWLFLEEPDFANRYSLAKSAGFEVVESADLYHVDLNELVEAREKADIPHVFLNAFRGLSGDVGISSLPGREIEFQESINKTIEYCQALKIPRAHLMNGRRHAGVSEEQLHSTFVSNARYATKKLAEHGIQALIEPVSTPGAFLNNLPQSKTIIDEINHPNLKLQLDLYHIQIIQGNLTENITKYFPCIDYVQVGQTPDRHEPDSAGEVNYKYIFDLLDKLGYTGIIGAEYIPAGETTAGLGWLETFVTK